jgi:transposase
MLFAKGLWEWCFKICYRLQDCVRRFNDGWESIENNPRVGRPVSVLTEKNVATVKMLIEEDACYTEQEIEELSGIHSSSVLKI